MTLRWHEVTVIFLCLFIPQSHTEAPVVCAVCSLVQIAGAGEEFHFLHRVLPVLQPLGILTVLADSSVFVVKCS